MLNLNTPSNLLLHQFSHIHVCQKLTLYQGSTVLALIMQVLSFVTHKHSVVTSSGNNTFEWSTGDQC